MSLLLALVLTTTTFAAGGTVPNSIVARPCGGENHSPQLEIAGVPAAARSLALIVHDPDAPHPGGFYHWVLYDLPPNTRTLPRDVQLDAKQTGRNGSGSVGYFGPCPPPGKPHHYHFTIYALDVATLNPAQPLSAEELLARMRGHILAQAEVVGVLER